MSMEIFGNGKSSKFHAPTSRETSNFKVQMKNLCRRTTLFAVWFWSFSGTCPSSLHFDAVAPKLKAKAEMLVLGAFLCSANG